MSRKKILWLCSWYPDKMEPFNGDFIQRHAAAAALYNDIYVIHLAGDSSLPTNIEEHITNTAEGLTEHLVYYKKPTSFFKKLRSYYRWAKATHHAIRLYIKAHGKPDLVHVHVPMVAGLWGGRIKRKYGIPYVITEHWTIYQPQNELKYGQQKTLFKSVLRRIIKGSKMLLPVSRDLGLLINKLVTEKDFTVVENVANEKYFYYDENKNPGTAFRFLHVSNMTYQKNAEGIIEGFTEFQKKFQEAELVIIGSVPVEMKQLMEKTGLLDKNIFLRGEISYAAVAGEMQQANALVMFSRFENSPCSIIEALCCGLPVIATDVGGISELLNENNGLLIDSLDKKALVAAFEKMVNNYPGYNRKKIAEQATSRFSYPVIGKKLDVIYTTVSAEKN